MSLSISFDRGFPSSFPLCAMLRFIQRRTNSVSRHVLEDISYSFSKDGHKSWPCSVNVFALRRGLQAAQTITRPQALRLTLTTWLRLKRVMLLPGADTAIIVMLFQSSFTVARCVVKEMQRPPSLEHPPQQLHIASLPGGAVEVDADVDGRVYEASLCCKIIKHLDTQLSVPS